MSGFRFSEREIADMGADMAGCMAEVSIVGRARKVTITLPDNLVAILDAYKKRRRPRRAA